MPSSMATRRKNLPRLDTAAAAQRGAWVSRGRGWRVKAMTLLFSVIGKT
jgi:hypothetical protein